MASLGPVVPGGSQPFGTHYKGGMPGLPSQRQLLMGSPSLNFTRQTVVGRAQALVQRQKGAQPQAETTMPVT